MPEHRDFSVRLVCDDADLEEFAVQVADERTVSCYVPSEVGKTFSIVMESNLDTSVVAHCHADGHFMNGFHISPHEECISSGPFISEDVIRPFQFAPLAVTDDETIANPRDPGMRDIGIIEVRVFRASIGEPTTASKKPLHYGPVHERCKKAGTHRVLFGEDTKVGKTSYFKADYVDRLDHPYATFIFRYRPRDVLQAQGILSGMDKAADDAIPSALSLRTTEETPESDSEIIVLDGPPPRKRRRSMPEDVKPIIDVDAWDLDDVDDTEIAAIEDQLRALTTKLEHAKRKKRRLGVDIRVKMEKMEEDDIKLEDCRIIDLSEA